jgi:hypothetical protein
MASDEMLLRRFSCLDLCRIGISYGWQVDMGYIWRLEIEEE